VTIDIPPPHVDDGVLQDIARSFDEDPWTTSSTIRCTSKDMEVLYFLRVEVSGDDTYINEVCAEHESGDWTVTISSRDAAKTFLGVDLLEAIDAIEDRMSTQYEATKQDRLDMDETYRSLRNQT